MNNSNELLRYVFHLYILFGGGFAWVLSFGQLFLRNRRLYNYILAAAFFFLGVWQTLGGLTYLGITQFFDFNIFVISIPSFYLTVPLLYFYFKCFIYNEFQFKPFHLLHLVLPLTSIALLAPYAYKKIDLYRVMNLSNQTNYESYELIISSVMYSSMLLYMAYLIRITLNIIDLLKQVRDERKKHIKMAMYGIIFLIALNAAWFVDRIFSLGLSQIIYFSVTTVLILIYLLSNMYPEYLLIIKQEAERVRYTRSQIENLDANLIVNKLKKLMEEEKLYKKRNISLNSLAGTLAITPHQLSEIINSKLNTNYYMLINEYRINEARKILVRQPESKILAVAYDVGFNSSSAFYNAFKKSMGVTPTHYREQHINHDDAPSAWLFNKTNQS